MDPNAPTPAPVPETPAQPPVDPTGVPWPMVPPKPVSPLGRFFGSVAGRVISIVIVAAVVIGIGVVASVISPGDNGKVIFTTNIATGTKCDGDYGTRVTTVSVSTPVYAIFVWKHESSEDASLVVLQDGKEIKRVAGFFTGNLLSIYGCASYDDDLNTVFFNSEPGTYKFQAVLDNGEVLAEGTLTVTP